MELLGGTAQKMGKFLWKILTFYQIENPEVLVIGWKIFGFWEFVCVCVCKVEISMKSKHFF